MTSMKLRFYTSDRLTLVDEIELSGSQMEKTGMWDAGIVVRKERYFRYDGMKEGDYTFVEDRLVSLDRSDI